MRNLHVPVWLHAFNRPTTPTFVTLYTIEHLSRAMLVTVVPLAAYEHLGDVQLISMLYLGIGLSGLLASLAVPWLVNKITRRGVLTLGTTCVAVGMALFSTGQFDLFVGGMLLHLFGGACLEVAISLFMMDHVPRQELGKFEPVRMFYSGAAWTVGPWLGVFLRNEVASWLPFALCGTFSIILLGYFWYLRLTENPAVYTKRKPVTNPITYITRFYSQPRLTLAWVLAVGRSGWWGMFFIYTPIYVINVGFSENMAGGLTSAGAMLVMCTPLLLPFCRRYGFRLTLVVGYIGVGIMTMAAAFFFHTPWVGVAMLAGASLFSVPIDTVGNTAFLRAVHPYERAEMTTVFANYRYTSQMVFPGTFSLLLRSFELPAVFIASGASMVALGLLAKFIPKRLK